MIRILKVWDAEYPWDVRTEKVSRTLTDRGHVVHMVARNRRRDALREELPECTVHRLKPLAWAGSRLDAASQFPAFFNPRWSTFIRRTARANESEVILVRDLPLAPTAINAGRHLGLPVILDMAENYPAMMRDLWTTGSTSFGDFFVRNPRAVEQVEKWVLRRIHHVVVVVEESRDRLIDLGMPPEKVSVVSNTPSLSRVEEFSEIRKARDVTETRGDAGLRLAYLGLMEKARGVGIVIEAVAALRAQGLSVSLDLVGDGRALPAFRKEAANLGLPGGAVRFHGFIPYQEALGIIAGADAGIIPHFANESWETTIPNKLFDYMSLGLPVVSSDVTPVLRVLEETGAGVSFRDRDSSDLVRVLKMLMNPAVRAGMEAAGRHAVRTRYHWEQDSARLHEALQRVVTAAMTSV